MNYNGINLETGLFYAGEDEKRYKESLKLFYVSSESEKTLMTEYLLNENTDYFLIKIHSLKGLAKSVGAEKLSLYASDIESLCREKSIGQIRNLWDQLLTEWNCVLEEILDFAGEDYILNKEVFETNGNSLDSTEFRILCSDIILALKNFDIDKAEELILNILKYNIEDTIKLKLFNALFKTRDFEYRKAIEQVDMALKLFDNKNND